MSSDIKEKRELSYGKKIAQYISGTISGSTTGYYFLRNNRFSINRRWASGKMDIQAMFQDRLELNGKINYINLSYKCIMLVNTIISRLVGRWMSQNEKISITAIDSLSVKEKNRQYEEAEYLMNDKENVAALEEAGGVNLVPPDQFIPEDKSELELWASEEQRLPEEILFEEGSNEALESCGWFDVLKEKMLHDSAEVGFVGTYTWMDKDGVIHVDWVKPENALYSFSEYPDFRDTTWRGQVISIKISAIRARWGNILTEKQIWEDICPLAKEYQLGDKIRWNNDWTTSFMRPYDEWNVDIIHFQLRSLDKEPVTVTTTKKNKSTLIRKGTPTKLEDNQEYIEGSTWNIYEGYYVRTADIMLQWGIKTNMIRPQDPKEIGNAEFSFSFYMYQNQDMRNLALPEKIEAPVEMMIGTCLKMQQTIAKMRPTGAAINWDALQEIDFGLGDDNKTINTKKLFDQTGDIYYRGRDAEGNPIPIPITELSNTGFLGQMQGLVQQYEFQYQVLKNELGEDPNLISQAATPRVTSSNIQVSRQEAEFATGYMRNAYVDCMEQTAKKVSCLLKTSVIFGAKAYRHIFKEKDISNKVFSTEIKMLPTEAEIAELQNMVNEAIAATPDIVLYLDPFKVIRMAKQNVKKAEVYFRSCMKKMIQSKKDEAQQNSEMNAKAQQESLQAKAQGDMQLEQMKADISMKTKDFDATKTKEIELLKGFMQVVAKDESGQLINTLMPAIQQLVPNITIPLMQENKQMVQGIQEQEKAEGEQAIQQQQIEEEAAKRGISPEELMQQLNQQQSQQPNQNQQAA